MGLGHGKGNGGLAASGAVVLVQASVGGGRVIEEHPAISREELDYGPGECTIWSKSKDKTVRGLASECKFHLAMRSCEC